MNRKAVVSLSLGLLCTHAFVGCTSTKLETGARMFDSQTPQASRSMESPATESPLQEVEFSGLRAAAIQIDTPSPARTVASGPLPPSFANSPFIQKLVKANVAALEKSTGRSADASRYGADEVRFNSGDFKHFLRDVIPSVGVDSWSVEREVGGGRSVAISDDNRQAEAYQRIQKYLVAYFAGKYVDRSGSLLSKPKIESNKLGNDSIVGFVTVIMDALYDSLYSTPVFCAKDGKNTTWMNPGGKEPFFAVYARGTNEHPAHLVINVNAKDCTLTTNEVQAIQFLSSVAAEQSKLLSGFVLRSFSDVEISFVVGGDFAVGDNETLAKVADCFFHISSERATEALGYRYFNTHDESHYGTGLTDLMTTVKFVYDSVK